MLTKLSFLNIFESFFFEGGLNKKQAQFFQVISCIFFGIGLFNIITCIKLEHTLQAISFAFLIAEMIIINIGMFRSVLLGRFLAILVASLAIITSLCFFQSTLIIKGSMMILIGLMIFFEKK